MDKTFTIAVLLLSTLLLSATIPDLAAVDKLFAEKRYAEALKGYTERLGGEVLG